MGEYCYDDYTSIRWYEARWGKYKHSFVRNAFHMLRRTLRRLDIIDDSFAFKCTPGEYQVLRTLEMNFAHPAFTAGRRRPNVIPDRLAYPADLDKFEERFLITNDVRHAAIEQGKAVRYSKLFHTRNAYRICYTASLSPTDWPADELDAINAVIHCTRTNEFATQYGELSAFEAATLALIKYVLVQWLRRKQLGPQERRPT